MSWLKITLAVKKGQLDFVSEQLELAGAQAVTIIDAGDHPLFDLLDGSLPVWDDSLATGLFSAEQGPDAVLAELANAFSPLALPQYQIEELPDQDWERSWMDRFQPIQYGDDLWVCPSWCEPQDPDATNIILDPGLAFGSGSHETTRLCMNWLSQHVLKNKTVIDYGCGSGILAIAALKRGADSALGIDIDPHALQTSRNNAQLNQVSERLQLELASNLSDQFEGDIIFANILAGTLLELRSQLLSYRKPGGILILSGILQSQLELIYKEFAPGNRIQVYEDGEWLMMSVIAQ